LSLKRNRRRVAPMTGSVKNQNCYFLLQPPAPDSWSNGDAAILPWNSKRK